MVDAVAEQTLPRRVQSNINEYANKCGSELCRNCVRSPRKHPQTPTFTGSHQEAFCGGKSLNRLREQPSAYYLVSVARIAFQACLIDRSSISPFRIKHLRAPDRMPNALCFNCAPTKSASPHILPGHGDRRLTGAQLPGSRIKRFAKLTRVESDPANRAQSCGFRPRVSRSASRPVPICRLSTRALHNLLPPAARLNREVVVAAIYFAVHPACAARAISRNSRSSAERSRHTPFVMTPAIRRVF